MTLLSLLFILSFVDLGRAAPVHPEKADAGGSFDTLSLLLLINIVWNIAGYISDSRHFYALVRLSSWQLEAWRRWRRQMKAFLSTVLIIYTIQETIRFQPEEGICNDEEDLLRMNPDIGGIGTRIGIYMGFLSPILIALIGHYHATESSAKDICGALCASKSSLHVSACTDLTLVSQCISSRQLCQSRWQSESVRKLGCWHV